MNFFDFLPNVSPLSITISPQKCMVSIYYVSEQEVDVSNANDIVNFIVADLSQRDLEFHSYTSLRVTGNVSFPLPRGYKPDLGLLVTCVCSSSDGLKKSNACLLHI